ncbi:MAG TPA: endo-1,4-beta-xylanase, partial [Cellvibrionaceae bacterium]|nr:endo-1,4-beta-xylanase [Cellvibrionaceae bacterium]
IFPSGAKAYDAQLHLAADSIEFYCEKGLAAASLNCQNIVPKGWQPAAMTVEQDTAVTGSAPSNPNPPTPIPATSLDDVIATYAEVEAGTGVGIWIGGNSDYRGGYSISAQLASLTGSASDANIVAVYRLIDSTGQPKVIGKFPVTKAMVGETAVLELSLPASVKGMLPLDDDEGLANPVLFVETSLDEQPLVRHGRKRSPEHVEHATLFNDVAIDAITTGFAPKMPDPEDPNSSSSSSSSSGSSSSSSSGFSSSSSSGFSSSSSSGGNSSTSSSGGLANLVFNRDLETNTNGWIARVATIERSVADSHSGTASLLVSNRGAAWQGAAYPLNNLIPGKTYKVAAWFKLAPGAAAETVKITGKRKDDADNSTYLEYTGVGSALVTAEAWTRIEGSYTPDGVTPFEAFIFESEGSSVFPSFYVDDFEVIGEAATSSSSSSSSSSGGGAMNIAKNGDVEADTANWLPRGATLARVTAEHYEGAASLLVSNRTASWQGAGFLVDYLTPGNTYQVSAWVKLAAGTTAATVKITGKRKDDSDSATYLEYSPVAAGLVTENEWVQLKGAYTYDGTTAFEAFILETDDAGKTASFYVDNFSVVGVVTPPPPPSIDIGNGLANNTAFPIGVAVAASGNANILTSVARQDIVKASFNEIVAENIMKMGYLYSGNEFSFAAADNLINWADSAGVNVHGHALVWHPSYQLPAWAKIDNSAFKDDFNRHIDTVAAHFAGKVVSWDVVNEALYDPNDDGDQAGTANGYRQSVFYKAYNGPSYIDEAFTRARAADPDAILYYNDFNTEANGAKTTALVALVQRLLDNNVPIDGVGFQMHVLSDWPSISDIRASMKKIVDLSPNLKIRISELDVRINNPYDGNTSNDYANRDDCAVNCAGLDTQKARYKAIVQAYLDVVPPAQRGGITVWGIADPDSWFYASGSLPDWPLLFNDNLQPKPAYLGVQEALKGL